MKAALVFLAIIGVGFAAPKPEGLVKHPRDLKDDIQDILDRVPTEEIKSLLEGAVKTDPAAANAMLYLQGSEWHELVEVVGAKPQVQAFLDDLTAAGLDVRGLIQRIHDFIESLVPGIAPNADASLRNVLDAIEAIVPIDDIRALIRVKLEISPDFQTLYKRLSSPDARALVEEILALPEVQRLGSRLRELGVKVDDVLAIIYDFLGWS